MNQCKLNFFSLKIVFKSIKAGPCTRFSVDMDNAKSKTECINRIEQPDVHFMK